MAATPYTATAKADGTAAISISPLKSGIQWTIAQTSADSVPQRPTAQVTVTLNGNLLTSSAIIPAVAGGNPAINLQSTDILLFSFTGLTAGDQAKVTIYYTETPWGTIPRADVV